MMGCAQAAQVFRRIRAALRQRHPMMHQRCLNVPTFCHAHLTERMLRQLRRTDRMPCSGMISLLVRRVPKECVVIPVCFLPMLLAELSIRQIRATGILAGLQWLSGHVLRLPLTLLPQLRAIEKPSQVLPCKGFIVVFCSFLFVQYNNTTLKTLMQPFQS